MKKVLETSVLSSAAYTLLFNRAFEITRHVDNDMEVEIVCGDGPEVELMREKGLKVHLLDMPRNLNPVKFIRAAWNFYHFVRREDYDLVHLHFGLPGLIGRTVAFFDRKRTYIYQSHGYAFDQTTPKYLVATYLMVERVLKNRVKFSLFQLREDMDIARKHNLLREDQLKYIANGIDVSRFKPDTSDKKVAGDTIIFGMTARFEAVKNHTYLLQAVEKLAKERNNFKVILIGAGVLKEEIEQEIKDRGIEHIVSLREYLIDITEFYKTIDVALLTSYFEGIPRGLLEPMCTEKPVICTDVKGSRELVVNNETGFVVDINKPAELAQRMQELIDSPQLREQFGKASRQRVLTRFSESMVVDKLETIYLEAMEHHGPLEKLAGSVSA